MGALLALTLALCAQAAAFSLAPTAPRMHQRPHSSRLRSCVPVNTVATPISTLPSTLLLAGDAFFGSVFAAGMSIAFASLATTLLVGLVVRSNYDEIEASFFDAQDEALEREASDAEQVDVEVRDFFLESSPPPPPPQTRASDAAESLAPPS
mmetsp:Transcript_54944/g.126471  ORF Transcript_54944/g.126471 Transcript_54944/m.126471 type:complete len:152 (-) Transcript_54944:341-796(-)